MFKTRWSRRLTAQAETKRTLETEHSTIQRQVEQFLDRIADTDVPSIAAAYEKRIRDLEGLSGWKKRDGARGEKLQTLLIPAASLRLWRRGVKN